MNFKGTWWLFRKESLRFLKVAIQTILAPVVVTLLYFLVFGSVLDEAVNVYNKVSYHEFLVPGLMMMTMMQNAFANSSSSLIQSKMNGNIIFMLLAPLSSINIFIAYVAAAILRGLIVGIAVLLCGLLFTKVQVYNLPIILIFAVLGSAILGIIGIMGGIVSDKYDHIAAFQNFIIMPLTFLSSSFYSIGSLSEFWQMASKFNPMFYMIDGFRYGFIGASDIEIGQSIVVTFIFLVLSSAICIGMLKSGYKIRN